ncbi:PBSX family phage portal protein [Alteromonadaceae bacterium 2753L.S.0a.02]|nr:PBSX family phage portal protein [Alteromonadaceae bacterium 2753L.S.0a.02]
MSKKRKQATTAEPEYFTFGEPTPVLSQFDVLYHDCWAFGSKYWEPPTDQAALSKIYRATAHHGSALQTKRNILLNTFNPTKYLNRQDFARLAQDFLILGNLYGEMIFNRLGGLIGVKPALARYVRRSCDLSGYWWVPSYNQETEFKTGSIIHVMQPDINQEVYGVPDYLGALQSVLLNESATLFRRKYYENGSHAGFILYMTDPAHSQNDVNTLREALKGAKGPGNFKNAFMYAPNGKKDGMQLIPVSEVAAKDEFLNIKNVSRDDQLAGHRVPPQLMGIIPNNTGGFGDAEKAARVFIEMELKPLQQYFLQLNDAAGIEIVKFDSYTFPNLGTD